MDTSRLEVVWVDGGPCPTVDHHEVIVELARIVARIEDGHTRLTLPLGPGVDFMQGHSETESPTLPEMSFHQYPVRFAVDSEGIWVRGASKDHEQILGGRLDSIDGRSAKEVIELVSPTIQRDNGMQVLHHLPMHLVLPELLRARGVTNSAERASAPARAPVSDFGGSLCRGGPLRPPALQ